MSEITKSLKKTIRKSNKLRESSRPLDKGITIGPYEIQDLLKEGSSSKIYLAKSLYTNEYVVIKALNKIHLQKNLDDLLLITKQIETLKILKHRNIITLYEIYESSKYIYLITEYCQGKDLIEKLIRKKRFNEEEALLIFFQLLDAFTYMHKMNICHRNIRTEHILFDKNNRPKIVGFGYSSFYEKNKKIEGSYGSLCYACPEIIEQKEYDPELADVWSLGVILYVLICGYLPFSDDDDNKNKLLITEGKIEFPKEISNKLKDLLRHMLDKNPDKRYNFEKIIKHPWIKPYSEKFFSQGINICKTVYPVDEKILNIINEYGFDKDKVKKDLIENKFNKGTGLYKIITRKLIDMKIKNISDLFSLEFNEYRDNEKNQYENGDKKYEDYINKVADKYNKKENYVNEFKEREDMIVEKLVQLKEYKNENNKLNVINEEKNCDKEDYDNNIVDNNNVEIVYNNDNDVDIIQQFKEEQNKKSVEKDNIIEEYPTHEKMPSEQNIINNEKDEDIKTDLRSGSIPSKNFLSINPSHKQNQSINNNRMTKAETISSISNSSLNQEDQNNFNGLILTRIRSKTKPNLAPSSVSKFRMTALRKTKTREYMDRGSLYDDFLKKNHPANIRKTMLKSKFKSFNQKINPNAIEDIKEKDENESENDKDDKKDEDDKDDKKNKELKFSFSFDDDDEEDEINDKDEEENIDIVDVIDGDGDSKLFNLLNNDDDEEIKELKKLYYGENLKESIKLLKKSLKKKKSVTFNKDVHINENKEKNKDNILKKSSFKKVGINNSGFNLDKYEEKLEEINKNLLIDNDKDDCNDKVDKIKLDSQLEISFHDDNEEKINIHFDENIVTFNKDKEYLKKIKLTKSEDEYDINDINNFFKKKYLYKFNKALPCNKINIIEENENQIEKINDFFRKKFKRRPLKRQKKLNKNEKNFCIDKVNDININKVIDKKNDSTQTNDFKNYKYGNSSRKYKLSRISFSIYSIINNRYNNYKDNDNDNNLFTYNGNNQIKNNLYNNKIRLNYYPKQTVSFVKKRKESDQNNNNNQQRYIKKYNNAVFDYDEIQTNKSYNLEKSPNFKSNLYKGNEIINSNHNYINTTNRRMNYQMPLFNNPNLLKNNNNYYYKEIKNYESSRTIPRKRTEDNSVNNIKNEVIVKRNEIVEKIQHCQNLLNTIIMDKKYIMPMRNNNINNKSTENIKSHMLTFNKKIPPMTELYTNKSIKKLNINNNRQNNEINQIYKKVNLNIDNEPKINNYTYKKINMKYIERPNDIYTFDNLSRDKIFNTASPTEYNNYIKPYTNKIEQRYFNTEVDIDNFSFEGNQNKKSTMRMKPGYNQNSYNNLNTKKVIKNQMNNNILYKNTSERNPNGLYNAIFRNKI